MTCKERNYPLYVFFLMMLALVSCKKDNGNKPGKGIELSLNSVEMQKAEADNSFSFNLFKTVAAKAGSSKNLFMSPLSVSMALGMTSNGANGGTLTAMDSTLKFKGFSQDDINVYYNKLVTQLPELDPNTTLNIANSIWYEKNFSVLPQFISTDSSYYHAKVQALDFGAPSSLNTINDWVSRQTSGKIPKMLDQISKDEVMFLINAIYFKSTWLNKFDPTQTKKLPFNLPDGGQVSTDFMSGNIKFNSFFYDNVYGLEMPYSNSKYSMVIVMPSGDKTLNDVIAGLNNDTWKSWMSRMSSQTNYVTLPKFKFSYDIVLNDALTTLGMGEAFSQSADFSRINPSGGLSISQVKHKAYVAVDETGTEAAAATSVGIQLTDAAPLIINRPFIFVIREMKTGLILFTGTVNNPDQSGN